MVIAGSCLKGEGSGGYEGSSFSEVKNGCMTKSEFRMYAKRFGFDARYSGKSGIWYLRSLANANRFSFNPPIGIKYKHDE